MIEPIMYVAIGFLVACMLVIGIIPVVHARAVRLTMRRLEAVTPMSMAEIQADKDQLRAEFAMSTRRLEMSVEQMKSKTTAQLAEIGKKSEAIGRLKLELGEKAAALFALEAKEKQLTEDLAETTRQRDEKASALAETERVLAETKSGACGHHRQPQPDVGAGRQPAHRARHRARPGRSHEGPDRGLRQGDARAARAADPRGRRGRGDAAAARRGDRQVRKPQHPDRRARAPADRADHRVGGARAPRPGTRWRGSTSRAAFSPSANMPPTSCATRFRSTEKNEADLRYGTGGAENRRRAAIEAVATERTLLEQQLKQSQAERSKLQDEIVAMKRDVETTWATERMENAVLRERINDVAAEVARLTSVLEGPGSTIDTVLASEPAHAPARRYRLHRSRTAPVATGGRSMARAARVRSPTASGRCRAAPRACRSRAGHEAGAGPRACATRVLDLCARLVRLT